MNVIKPAVAENCNDIFRLQHWQNSIHNRVRISLLKRRPARTRNPIDQLPRIQPLALGNLLDLCHI